MTFVLPEDLAPELYPLAWLVGTWRGAGVVEYPNIPRTDCEQDVEFTHDGGPYLQYRAVTTLLGPDGERGHVWASESGYWRVAPQPPEGIVLNEGQFPVEVILTDASGVVSAFLGAVGNGRIDLGAKFMARLESAPEVVNGTRMYGNVSGELLWAWDLAAFGEDLQSYASGRLSRVDA